MKRFTTNDEIENLCEAMIKDFFKSKHYTNVMCVDIEAFVQEQVVFPARTAVIEKYLLNQKESARRRFSIAHEGAHDVLGRHIPLQTSPAAAFHSEFDPEMRYTQDMLKEMLSINECFTNRAAACFLMPAFLVARVLKRHNNLSQDQKLLIQKMADTLGVSFTAFHTRLSELDLFERRPVEEYLHEGLRYGGELHAGSN